LYLDNSIQTISNRFVVFLQLDLVKLSVKHNQLLSTGEVL